MFSYDRAVNTAKRLIEKYGAVCVWNSRALTGGTPDAPTQTVTNRNVVIAFVPTKQVGKESIHGSKNEQRAGDVTALMGQVDFIPSARDTITRAGGQPLRIKSIKILNPAATTVFYKIECET